MALTGYTVDVPLKPMDQQSPDTSGPLGELSKIVNGVVRKFERDGAPAIRVEKRWGWNAMVMTAREPINALPAAQITDPTLMSSLGDQLLVADDNNPVVYAEDSPTWERFDYIMPTRALTRQVVYTSNTQAEIVDGAGIGGVYCYVWREGRKARCMVVDADGTPLREPFTFDTAPGTNIYDNVKVKVIEDGANFWVFYSKDQSMSVMCLNGTTGAELSRLSFATLYFQEGLAPSPWDVQSNSIGALWAGTISGGTTRIYRFTIAGTAITAAPHDMFSANFTRAIAFMTNETGNGLAYLAGFSTLAIEFNSSFVVTHSYSFMSYPAGVFPANFAGYALPTGDLILWQSFVDGTTQTNSYTRTFKLFHNGDPLEEDAALYTTTSASRAFLMNGRMYVVQYYGSVTNTILSATNLTLGQPTYFLADMETHQICGRWDYGSAAQDWVEQSNLSGSTGSGSGDWHLASPFASPDNVGTLGALVHLPLCYRAQSINQGVDFDPRDALASVRQYIKQVSTVGVEDIRIGKNGRAVEYSGELMIPGPEATSFTGYEFSEHGINLAPEAPTLVSLTTTGGLGLTPGQQYGIRVVYEWTTPQGDRARSQPSPPMFVNTLTYDTINLLGRPIYVTNHRDVVISIYVTAIVAGVMSTIHYKVTNDLAPLLNDTTAASWTYSIHLPDTTIQVGEELYTDQGFLPRDPCPAFSTGCVFNNRMFVVGYDGAVWYSGEKVEGESLWFNQDVQRLFMPTRKPVRACFPLDGRIIFQCDDQQWFLPGGVFPDATGRNGNVPTPERLPFTNGGTGLWTVTRDGAIYAASNGGVWMVTRGLENKHLGADIIDDFDGRRITGIDVDVDQQVIVSTTSDGFGIDYEALVWDVVSGVWSKWTMLAGDPMLATTWHGRYTFFAGTAFFRQISNQYNDDGNAIITEIDVKAVHLGGVKNFKRVWAIQIYGQYRGDHDLHVVLNYDDNAGQIITPYNFTPSPSTPYLYELPPTVELCSSIGFRFYDSFPRSGGEGGPPRDSFALEMLSFYVGLEKGLNKIPIAQRVPPGDSTYVVPGSGGMSIGTVNSINGTGTTLVGYNVAGLVSDAFFVWVKTRGRMFRLTDATTTPNDGIDIVAAADGRQWMVI